MSKPILFLDELRDVSPEHKKLLYSFILTRPTLGKSKLAKKATKELNKRRRKLGLKKLKTVELKLPKGWKHAQR